MRVSHPATAVLLATATVGFSPTVVEGAAHPPGWRWAFDSGKEFQFRPNAGVGAMLTWTVN